MRHLRSVPIALLVAGALGACGGGGGGGPGGSGSPVAARPTFAPPPGSYSAQQQVTLACDSPGPWIYYTLDGSTPTSLSNRFIGAPIHLSAPTTVKAICTSAGMADSPVVSATYLITLGGTYDPAFAGSGRFTVNLTLNDFPNAVLVQPDGKIVAGGVAVAGGFYDFALLRFGSDGTADPGFGSGGVATTQLSPSSDVVNALALQPDGKIVAAGSSGTLAALARYDAAGVLDPAFGTSGIVRIALGTVGSNVTAVALLDDGRILAGGWADSGTGWSDFMAARFAADGTLDPTFGSSGVATIPIGTLQDHAYAMAVQADGKIVLAGETLKPGTTWDMALVRLEADGALDATFGAGGKVLLDYAGSNDGARAVAVLPDGKILAGGSASVVSSVLSRDFALARFTAQGALDSAFGTGGKVTTEFWSPTAFKEDEGYGMAVQPDGRIVLVGKVWSRDWGVARYLPDGALDPDFGRPSVDGTGLLRIDFALPNDDDAAQAVALQPDGKIVVVGKAQNVWNFSADTDWAIARLLP